MAPSGYLMRTAATVLGSAVLFVAGLLTERHRPCGTEWHRVQAVRLARRIAEMDLDRCCHD